ncbi:hypothetical protein ACRYCC_08420 [Actinomadura scrupuli]|uniref:hypothetical protein n=1 Tax=Actinomadura scrupuli TaxID=559629 RepID=UPI003D95BDAC
MRLAPRAPGSSRRDLAYTLRLPEGADPDRVTELLQRYDPYARRRRRTIKLTGSGATLRLRGAELVVPPAEDVLARALRHHLGGSWLVPPPAPDGDQEPLQDLARVFVPRKLLAAELATLLRPVLPGVAIRDDPKLELFWFDDEDSELTISAWVVRDRALLPPAVNALRDAEAVYEVGIDDVNGPTPVTAGETWRIVELLQRELGGVAVDRYGFRLTGPTDLMPR